MYRFIIKISFIILAVLLHQNYSNAADSDCVKSPGEALKSLDGSWSFQQGAGFAVAAGPSGNKAIPVGGMAIPLPPHPAQQVKVMFDDSKHHATLSASGETMAMAAGTEAELSTVSKYLKSDKIARLIDKNSKKAGCSWDSLPYIVGSSTYTLDTSNRINHMYLDLGPFGDTMLCLDENGKIIGTKGLDRWDIERCEKIPNKKKNGDMKMTVILKFTGSKQGAGLLLFEGTQDGGYKFSATAPITMSR